MRNALRCLGSLLLLALASTASAERSESFGDYTVHYNAFTTDALDPTVARAYGIVRSTARAMINVTVLKKVMGTTGQPVRASVSATATNLSAQLKTIDMRELNEGGAIYYIGELPVSNTETLDFSIKITPEDGEATHALAFRQQFFTE